MNLIPSFKLAGIAAAVAFALGAWRVTSWQYQAREAQAVRAAAAAERASLQYVIDSLRGQVTAANEASDGYQKEIARRDAAAQLDPAVRVPVCPGGTAGQLPATSTAASGPDTAGKAGGMVPGPSDGDLAGSRDIGPELKALVIEADRCSAQLRALQEWVRRVSQ